MDVQRNTRERVFSILNDSNNPSFTFRQRQQSPTRSFATTKLPSISSLAGPLSPRTERPSLFRYPQFERTRSISSAGSPPLLSHDSTSSSSKSSSGSMDSTPSPITPAYNYNDNTLIPYDSLLRQDLNGAAYLPSPTGITPFMDQTQLMTPMAQDPFTQSKQLPTLIPATAYPLPVPPQQAELQPQPQPQQQMPTPALSTNNSVASIPVTSPQQATKSTHANNANNTGKKNKYPCPYATSHNCSATFTTSGHAARHGKKHTGEKGVHCPVCDKAFTRKDNMKQHERTHKNHQGSGEDRKSKAQITREANKAKAAATAAPAESDPLPELQQPARIRKSSSGISDPSESTMASTLVETPNMNDSLFPDAPQISIIPDNSMPMSMQMPSGPVSYPNMAEDAMITGAVPFVDEKLDRLVPQPPALLRGFSDLDTLAQAAASDFDPYLQANTY